MSETIKGVRDGREFARTGKNVSIVRRHLADMCKIGVPIDKVILYYHNVTMAGNCFLHWRNGDTWMSNGWTYDGLRILLRNWKNMYGAPLYVGPYCVGTVSYDNEVLSNEVFDADLPMDIHARLKGKRYKIIPINSNMLPIYVSEANSVGPVMRHYPNVHFETKQI